MIIVIPAENVERIMIGEQWEQSTGVRRSRSVNEMKQSCRQRSGNSVSYQKALLIIGSGRSCCPFLCSKSTFHSVKGTGEDR